MEYLGQITVQPTSGELKIADLDLQDGENAIWLRVTQVEPDDIWPFAYGLVYWKNSNGRELGTVKAYSHTESEIFLLTEYRAPGSPNGALYFQPRAYNRLWINAHKDDRWVLDFSYETGNALPQGGLAAISGVFADKFQDQLPLVVKGENVILGN